MILLLFDLSAAFDTVDHKILISRLEQCVGIEGSTLDWFESYLNARMFSVSLDGFSSSVSVLDYGVPQGSILSPALFSLYLLPLGTIFSKHGVSFHFYADDTQIYLPLKKNDKKGLSLLSACVSDVKSWFSSNFLHLNESKTEAIIFSTPGVSIGPNADLGVLAPYVKPSVTNLGLIFDSALKFDKQISAVVKSSFFQLRLLSKAKSFLTFAEFERVIHLFISSRLDYCNSLYIGMSQSNISRLQMVQNAAARLLTGTRKFDHVTPILRSLHWLPVCHRIEFKILLFVFKAMNNLAPSYLSDLLKLNDCTRSLRSSQQRLLMVPRSRLKTRGDRAFSVVGPKLWNSLPVSLRLISTESVFKSKLKTYLFSLAYKCP